MKEINGNEQINARIRIDYSKKKPQVSFKYPDKKHQFRGSMFTYIFSVWLILMFPLYLYAMFQFDALDDTNGQDKLNLSNYDEFKLKIIEYCSSEKVLKEKFDSLNESFLEQFKTNFKSKQTQRALLIILLMVLPPFFIYFPFRKRWNKYYPDLQAWLATKKYKRFTTKDIKFNYPVAILQNSKEKYPYYVELPVFHNIICDFKATKDFSKYVKEFEIEEYKFNYCKLKRRQKKGKKGLEKNEWIWYARWYFDKKPIKGDLKVIFK
ncbi:MAG: hypothetical protein ABIH82_03965 [Candidatus Woesearchaeota archaeon]